MELSQKYSDVQQFAKAHGILLPSAKVSYWRLTKRIVGQINGIPSIRGILTATNGILCFIESEAGVPLLGHIGWFEPDQADDREDVANECAQENAPARRWVASKQKMQILNMFQ